MIIMWRDYDEAGTVRESEVTSDIQFLPGAVLNFWGILNHGDGDRETATDEEHNIDADHVLWICDN